MVIQRWQSLLLLIAGVMMAIFTFLSLGQVQLPDYTLNISTMGVNIEGELTDGQNPEIVGTVYIFVVSLLTVILPLVNIFLFKNLRLQKRICLINILCICVVVANIAIIGYSKIPEAADVAVTPSWSSAVISPFIAIVASICAWRCMRSDEKKLKSYDRLR